MSLTPGIGRASRSLNTMATAFGTGGHTGRYIIAAFIAVIALGVGARRTAAGWPQPQLVSATATGVGDGDSGVWETIPGQSAACHHAQAPVLDDQTVHFLSAATNLTPDDATAFRDVLRRLPDGQLELASRPFNTDFGEQLNFDVDAFAISTDKRLFAATAANAWLFDGVTYIDEDIDRDVFLWDFTAQTVAYVSSIRDADSGDYFGATPPTGESRPLTAGPALAGSGDWAAFSSVADDLVPDDTNLASDVFLYNAGTGTLVRVSVAADGTEANGDSWSPAISQDGGRIVFHTEAGNLPGGGRAEGSGVYLYRRDDGVLVKVSRWVGNATGNDNADQAAISGDGAWVAYRSGSGRHVSGDRNAVADVFLYSVADERWRRVSVSSNGAEADAASGWPALNYDGRFIVFASRAGNLVEDNTGGLQQVYLHDREAGVTVLLSRAADGSPANADCCAPALSPSGRFVTFSSKATNLAAGASGAHFQVFLIDRGEAYLNHSPRAFSLETSVSPDGARTFELDGEDVDGDALTFRLVSLPENGVLAYDGQAVEVGDAFPGPRPELLYTPNPGRSTSDSFLYRAEDAVAVSAAARVSLLVHDYASGFIIRRLSADPAGTGGDADSQQPNLYGDSLAPSITADGRLVAFVSRARNLIPGQDYGFGSDNVFLYERDLESLTLLSVGTDGRGADGNSSAVTLTPDGANAVFESEATNLMLPVPGAASRRLYRKSVGDGWIAALPVTGSVPLYPAAANGPVADAAFVDGTSIKALAGVTAATVSTDLVGTPSSGSSLAVNWLGSAIAFDSASSDLVTGDSNDAWDVFVARRGTDGTTQHLLVSRGVGDAPANGLSVRPSISMSGRFVAFESAADNLVADDANGLRDVFVADFADGSIERISRAPGGGETDGHSLFAAISADGRFVWFKSYAGNLLGDGGNRVSPIHAYCYDRLHGTMRRVTENPDLGIEDGGEVGRGALSANGRFAVFSADKDMLVAGDTEGRRDVFLVDMGDPENQAPVASAGTVGLLEDEARLIQLAASDAEDNDLIFELVNGPANGSLTEFDPAVYPGHPSPTVLYRPNENSFGVDSFSFRCRDGKAWSAPASVELTVTEVNDPPTLASVPDQSIAEGETLVVPLAVDDPDVVNPVPDEPVVSVVAGPGAIVPGGYLLTPDYDVASKVQPNVPLNVTLRASDGRGGTADRSFTVTVTDVDRPPEVNKVTLAPASPHTADMLTALVDATDPDGDPVTLTVKWYADGAVQPALDDSLEAASTLTSKGQEWRLWARATAGGLDSASVWSEPVTILNTGPTAVGQALEVAEDGALSIFLAGQDPDADVLAFTVTEQPGHGALSGVAPNLTYRPDSDFSGDDSLWFRVSDGDSESASAVVIVTVKSLPDPPVLTISNRLIVFDDEQQAAVTDQLLVVTDVDEPQGVTAADYTLLVEAPPSTGELRDSVFGVLAAGAEVPLDHLPLSYSPATGRGFNTEQASFRVRDAGGLVSEAVPLEIVVGARRLEMLLRRGWNCVSMPFEPLAEARTRLLEEPGIEGVAWTYDASRARMRQADELHAGVAYWLRSSTSLRVSELPGAPVATTYLPVTRGWNALGPVGEGVSRPLPDSGLLSSVWLWDAGLQRWQLATRVERGMGYWFVYDGDASDLDLGLQ